MSPLLMRGMLGVALVGTLVAGYFAPDPQGDAVAPVSRAGTTRSSATPAANASIVATPASNAQRTEAAGDIEVLAIQPRTLNDESRTVFQMDRRPPAANTPVTTADQVELPPPPAQAPPLPFKVLGRYVEADRVKIFLQHDGQDLVVQVGDSIAGLYQVESLNDGVLTLLYVPLNQKQTLDVGADK